MQYNIENKTLICIGDVHGEFATLRFKLAQYIKKYGLTDTIFIVCGDCGFGFGKGIDEFWKKKERPKIEKLLKARNCELYFFRGNHDNPKIFKEYPAHITENSEYFKVLGDYDIITSDLYGTILIVPGAISIDRFNRDLNWDFWSDEKITYLPEDELKCLPQVDIVLSHSVPHYLKVNKDLLAKLEEKEHIRHFGGTYLGYTNKLSVDLEIEITYLLKLQESVQAKLWVSGHYHQDLEIIDGNVKYQTLDIFQFYPLDYKKNNC